MIDEINKIAMEMVRTKNGYGKITPQIWEQAQRKYIAGEMQSLGLDVEDTTNVCDFFQKYPFEMKPIRET